jgi:hypothetical protein
MKAISEVREITDRNSKSVQSVRTVMQSIIAGTAALTAEAGDRTILDAPASTKRRRPTNRK